MANWKAAASAVARLHADLTVHLGDISLDGQLHPEELQAKAWPTPLHFLPGNHDLGDGSGEAALDAVRRTGYEAAFGADHWTLSAGRWELIGINAQLLGSGTPQDRLQANRNARAAMFHGLHASASTVWFDLLCPDGMVRHKLVELGFDAGLRAYTMPAWQPKLPLHSGR